MTKSPNGIKIIDCISKEKVLTETDGPYTELLGIPLEPRDNDLTIAYLSKRWSMTTVAVEELIELNFKKLIGLIR